MPSCEVGDESQQDTGREGGAARGLTHEQDAAVALDQPHERHEQRRLARAGPANDGEVLAPRARERQPVEHDRRPVAHGQAVDDERAPGRPVRRRRACLCRRRLLGDLGRQELLDALDRVRLDDERACGEDLADEQAGQRRRTVEEEAGRRARQPAVADDEQRETRHGQGRQRLEAERDAADDGDRRQRGLGEPVDALMRGALGPAGEAVGAEEEEEGAVQRRADAGEQGGVSMCDKDQGDAERALTRRGRGARSAGGPLCAS